MVRKHQAHNSKLGDRFQLGITSTTQQEDRILDALKKRLIEIFEDFSTLNALIFKFIVEKLGSSARVPFFLSLCLHIV